MIRRSKAKKSIANQFNFFLALFQSLFWRECNRRNARIAARQTTSVKPNQNFQTSKKRTSKYAFFSSSKSSSDLIQNALLRRNKIKSLTMSAPTYLGERIFRVFFQSTDKRLFRTKTRVSITLQNCAASAFNKLWTFFKHFLWIKR